MIFRASAFAAFLLAGSVAGAHADSVPVTAERTPSQKIVLNGTLNMNGLQGGVQRAPAVYIDNGTRVFIVKGDGFHQRRRAAGFAAAAALSGSGGFR